MIIILPTLLESLGPAAAHNSYPMKCMGWVFFFLFQMLHVWIAVFAYMISVKNGNIQGEM